MVWRAGRRRSRPMDRAVAALRWDEVNPPFRSFALLDQGPSLEMLTRCLHCYQPFPRNRTLENFGIGRRVAFDPEHGRLWAICPACYRWTLAPFEERWETLEQLERLSAGRARLLAKSDNIALLHADDLEIIRIGFADRREEAWWRYGREFLGRRARAGRVTRLGRLIDAGAMLAITGLFPLWGWSDSEEWVHRARRKHFGRDVWRGSSLCARCGDELSNLLFEEWSDLVLEPGDCDPLALWYSCPRCGENDSDAGHRFTGLSAEHLLRRMMAYANFAGGDEEAVASAMSLIEDSGSAEGMLQQAAARRCTINQFSGRHILAIEIALANDVERGLLGLELKRLEARWREEEEIAGIVDRELTPP
jgi:hypothetical protein